MSIHDIQVAHPHVLVIVCMSARKKAPVNLLMCTFELYMFIGVSMQLRDLSEVSSDPILLGRSPFRAAWGEWPLR